MNPEDIIRQFQAQFDGQHQQQGQIPEEKLDLFIDRCLNEKNYALYTLGQAIQYKLNPPEGHTTMHSFEESWILPQVLQQIEKRYQKGER